MIVVAVVNKMHLTRSVYFMELPVVIILFGLLTTFYGCTAKEVRPCNVSYRCSSEEDTAWATDDKSCHVLRNGCLLKTVNCDRLNRHEPELKEVTKEVCQKLCRTACTEEYRPLCGYYNDVKRTFPNQCVMDSHICTTGETFGLFSAGECKEKSYP